VIYVQEDDRLVVSSEDFGQARPAAWPLNLDADPRVTVQLGAAVRPYLARPASKPEIARLWPRLVAAWPAHETYRRRSERRQIFVLEPAG
jgi:deazaflavin-dependent oxidoreductase (nitroreductase family)